MKLITIHLKKAQGTFVMLVTYIVEIIALYQLGNYNKLIPFTNIKFDMLFVITILWSIFTVINLIYIFSCALAKVFIKDPTVTKQEYKTAKHLTEWLQTPVRELLSFLDLIVGSIIFVLAAEQGLIYLSVVSVAYLIATFSLKSASLNACQQQIEIYERSKQ